MLDDCLWRAAPQVLTLDAGEVHVWRADLAALTARQDELAALLDPAESARAARFLFARDRERFVGAHGLLRLLLGRYTALAPASLRFVLGPRGKPALAEGQVAAGLHFNLSHSHELALFVFARAAAVGVDVEHVRPDLPWQKLARRVLCPREQQWLAALPAEAGQARFFDLWVAKEAYAKALGAGLGLPLASVSVDPSTLPRLRLADAAAGTPQADWSGGLLAPGPGYAGAVVHQAGANLRCWQA